jgi:hypothetical protein
MRSGLHPRLPAWLGSRLGAWLGGRRRVVALAGLVGVVAGAGVWLMVRGEPPRARVYREVSACLVTGASGVLGEPAASVWAGMQAASASSAARVRYLEVDGPQTVDNAADYVAGLVAGRCTVVLAAGPVPADAARAKAHEFPDVRFVLIGATESDQPLGENVKALPGQPPDDLRAAVRGAVLDTVG